MSGGEGGVAGLPFAHGFYGGGVSMTIQVDAVSFCYNVGMVKQSFVGQQAGEQVDFVFRRHYSVMLEASWPGIALLAVGGGVLTQWSQYPWSWYVALGLVVVGLLKIFGAWLSWYYSVNIVTNQRIRQQIQRGLFHKTTTDINLAKVENIQYNIDGLRGSMAGYGTIILQTMVGDMVMTKIAGCEQICGRLNRAVQRSHRGASAQEENR